MNRKISLEKAGRDIENIIKYGGRVKIARIASISSESDANDDNDSDNNTTPSGGHEISVENKTTFTEVANINKSKEAEEANPEEIPIADGGERNECNECNYASNKQLQNYQIN